MNLQNYRPLEPKTTREVTWRTRNPKRGNLQIQSPAEPQTLITRTLQNHRHVKPVDLETRISRPGDQVLQSPLTHVRPAERDCIFSACLCACLCEYPTSAMENLSSSSAGSGIGSRTGAALDRMTASWLSMLSALPITCAVNTHRAGTREHTHPQQHTHSAHTQEHVVGHHCERRQAVELLKACLSLSPV